MSGTAPDTTSEVIELIATTLGIEDRSASFDRDTRLLGELPELDSQGVVLLLLAIEDQFGFQIDDADFSGDTFETVGSLVDYVDSRRS